MSAIVYVLCALTSLTCSGLLFRSYYLNRVRLLLWSAVCFGGLTINNFVLFFDLVVYPNTDLSWWRLMPGLVGLVTLIYGVVWDTL